MLFFLGVASQRVQLALSSLTCFKESDLVVADMLGSWSDEDQKKATKTKKNYKHVKETSLGK